ncbi:MAG: signal peptidase II, partial [Bacteroidaceae bacterium]|nr:signal peptidase II [Bacteroidaceae bacterium]
MLNNKVKINAITAVAIVAAVIFIDQSIKFYVKTNFALHEAHEITSWMYLYFVENSGMAFGVNIAGTLILTVARLIFVGFLIYYISRISSKNVPRGYIICISLIIAGALGNIIDNAIYGMIFSESTDYN